MWKRTGSRSGDVLLVLGGSKTLQKGKGGYRQFIGEISVDVAVLLLSTEDKKPYR